MDADAKSLSEQAHGRASALLCVRKHRGLKDSASLKARRQVAVAKLNRSNQLCDCEADKLRLSRKETGAHAPSTVRTQSIARDGYQSFITSMDVLDVYIQ